jgi:hypothetical protein
MQPAEAGAVGIKQPGLSASKLQAAQLDAMVLLHQQVCKSVATAQMRAVRTSGNQRSLICYL